MTTFDDDPLLMTLVRIDRLSPASAQGQRVELPMTAEDRQRVRRRIVASDGQELALALHFIVLFCKICILSFEIFAFHFYTQIRSVYDGFNVH